MVRRRVSAAGPRQAGLPRCAGGWPQPKRHLGQRGVQVCARKSRGDCLPKGLGPHRTRQPALRRLAGVGGAARPIQHEAVHQLRRRRIPVCLERRRALGGARLALARRAERHPRGRCAARAQGHAAGVPRQALQRRGGRVLSVRGREAAAAARGRRPRVVPVLPPAGDPHRRTAPAALHRRRPGRDALPAVQGQHARARVAHRRRHARTAQDAAPEALLLRLPQRAAADDHQRGAHAPARRPVLSVLPLDHVRAQHRRGARGGLSQPARVDAAAGLHGPGRPGRLGARAQPLERAHLPGALLGAARAARSAL